MPPQLRVRSAEASPLDATRAAWASSVRAVCESLASTWNAEDHFPDNPNFQLATRPGFSAPWFDAFGLFGYAGRGLSAAGTSPAEAVAQLREQAHLLVPECWSAIAIAWHFALLDTLGPERFDRVASEGLSIYMGQFKGLLKPGNVVEHHNTPPPVGAWVYFDNPGANAQDQLFWKGENALKVGPDEYYAHPFGIVSEAEILAKLAEKVPPGGPPPRRRGAWREIDFTALTP
jgi:hypothetical protein